MNIYFASLLFYRHTQICLSILPLLFGPISFLDVEGSLSQVPLSSD